MQHIFTFSASYALAVALAACAAAAEPSELEGNWIEIAPERPRIGYSPPFDPANLEVRGNLFVMKAGDRPFRQSLLRLVPGRGPKAIDLMTVVDGEFWLTRAIYKIDGDLLSICESTRDGERPPELRTGQGVEGKLTVLTTFRRVERGVARSESDPEDRQPVPAADAPKPQQ
jgi:uncharacterized protein (TIGR03067 family)